MQCDKLIEGGFSFCGVDIADLGLTYVPEKEDTYVYAPAEANIYEETFEGHNGGYYYGASKQPKEFKLRCLFEESSLDEGVMAKIHNLFRIGKAGKLIFARRPWCYYYATVTSVPHPELNNYMNGLVTINMKAYYPYARSDKMYNELTDVDHFRVMRNTAMPESEDMIPQTSFTNLTEQTEILLLNPGTERAHVSIIVAGDVGDGVTIYNKTTNQTCGLVAISKADTTDSDKEVYIDGVSGKTLLRGSSESELAFMYHDEGFIELESAGEPMRQLFAYYEPGNTVMLTNQVHINLIGKYIYIDNKWRKIVEQINSDVDRFTVTPEIEHSGNEKTMVVSMNELIITPKTTMNLDKLNFSYKPTFA